MYLALVIYLKAYAWSKSYKSARILVFKFPRLYNYTRKSNKYKKKTYFFYQAEQQKNIKFKQQKAKNLSEGKDENIITRLKSKFENV